MRSWTDAFPVPGCWANPAENDAVTVRAQAMKTLARFLMHRFARMSETIISPPCMRRIALLRIPLAALAYDVMLDSLFEGTGPRVITHSGMDHRDFSGRLPGAISRTANRG